MEGSGQKKGYKYCIVPKCESTSAKPPNKTFISLPRDVKARKQWQTAMKRGKLLSDKSTFFVCEDHFNLEEDMENYIQFKLMGNVKIKMKPGIVPHIFDCQVSRTEAHTQKSRGAFLKRQRQTIIEDLEKPSTSKKNRGDTENVYEETNSTKKISDVFEVTKCTKAIQVNIRPKLLSKEVQCSQKNLQKETFKMRTHCSTLLTSSESSSSTEQETSSGSFQITSDSSFAEVQPVWNKRENVEKRAIFIIEKNPKLYLGIPTDSLFLIEMISLKCQIDKTEVYITLKKIKLNLPYHVLGDDFCKSVTSICLIIQKSIPKISSFFVKFIQWKRLSETRKCLPIPFRRRFKNVQCIIDCFEISIQKPSDPVLQSLSWSEYKKANTMKYLIACTPDGLISFVSSGYGGRTSDKMIVEESKYFELLDDEAHVMADRGFKHIDELLVNKGNVLVRPPSVSAKEKSSKEEVKYSKKIASLRIHVERVISRVREFNILGPHACVNINLIKYLDDIVIIASGIINVQNYLIN